VDEESLFSWDRYFLERLESWMERSGRHLSVGLSPCRVGLLWCPTATLRAITASNAKDYADRASGSSVVLGPWNRASPMDVALSVLSQAFRSMRCVKSLLPDLATFCRPAGTEFAKAVHARCLRSHKITLKTFRTYLNAKTLPTKDS
jgi:hypothetical protein